MMNHNFTLLKVQLVLLALLWLVISWMIEVTMSQTVTKTISVTEKVQLRKPTVGPNLFETNGR